MAKTLHIALSGPAEQFVNRLVSDKQLSERDVIAKALGLLRLAVETGRVALIKSGQTRDPEAVEYYLTLEFPESTSEPLGATPPSGRSS